MGAADTEVDGRVEATAAVAEAEMKARRVRDMVVPGSVVR